MNNPAAVSSFAFVLHPFLTVKQVYTFVQDFVVGNSQAGSMIEVNGLMTVIGGENPTMNQSAIPGQAGIGYGSYSTSGLYTYPTAAVAVFYDHIGIVPMTGTSAIAPTPAP